jgi:hypothetical protein
MTERLERALSIRQPYVELILRGKKREEYRSRQTHVRGRVYTCVQAKSLATTIGPHGSIA